MSDFAEILRTSCADPIPACLLDRRRRVREVAAVPVSGILVLIVGCLVLIPISGCHRPKQRYKPASLVTRSDVSRYAREALEDPDADIRRSAIEQIAKTRHFDSPVAVDAFALAARTDLSASVRCAAVRALGRCTGDKPVYTMIAILMAQDEGSGVRPASASVRWEAMGVLYEQVRAGLVTPAATPTLQTIAIERLKGDASRDVVIVAARLLGYCPTVEVVRVLVGALRRRDFGVVYEAERSLMRLTGKTFDHDPARWTGWLEATADPFAERGGLDDQLGEPARRGRWPFRKRS